MKYRGLEIERRQPKSKRFCDLTGNQYGQMTVLSLVGFINRSGVGAIWRCECVCGRIKLTTTGKLKSGEVVNCGSGSSHGFRGEYQIWLHIIDRCRNPQCPNYRNYGGRGIDICDIWHNSFLTFLRDVKSRPAKNLSVDRIDNDGNYEPGNVRWATAMEQVLNGRVPRFIEVDNVRLCLAGWGRKFRISRERVRQLANKHGDEMAIRKISDRYGVAICD